VRETCPWIDSTNVLYILATHPSHILLLPLYPLVINPPTPQPSSSPPPNAASYGCIFPNPNPNSSSSTGPEVVNSIGASRCCCRCVVQRCWCASSCWVEIWALACDRKCLSCISRGEGWWTVKRSAESMGFRGRYWGGGACPFSGRDSGLATSSIAEISSAGFRRGLAWHVKMMMGSIGRRW
jgi:hypothetical protein